MAYRKFVGQLRAKDPAVIELIAMIDADRTFPEIDTWQQLRRHLTKIGADHTAFVAGRSTWQQFRAAKRGKATVLDG